MATIKIKVDLKEEKEFLISNKDAEFLLGICSSLEDLEMRIINEVD